MISPGTTWSTFAARTRRISLIGSRDRGRPSSPTSRRVALGFPRSHDVYGDGSIVCVPAPGHTPGSIIVFVALPNNVRYALVGDLVWQREGLTNLEERPLLSRLWADLDPDGTRQNILRMASIVERIPNMIVVPAHDQRAFADMAELPNVTTKGLIL